MPWTYLSVAPLRCLFGVPFGKWTAWSMISVEWGALLSDLPKWKLTPNNRCWDFNLTSRDVWLLRSEVERHDENISVGSSEFGTYKAIDTRPALNRFQVIQISIIKIPVDFEFVWCTQMTRKKNNLSRSHAEKNAAFYVKRMLVPGKNLRSPPPARSILKVSC